MTLLVSELVTLPVATNLDFRLRYSFICQGTLTRRQRSFLWVKLPPVTTSPTTQR